MTTEKTYRHSETCRVQFSDGRKGIQTVHVFDDGSRELADIIVTVTADGKRCEDCYGPRRFLRDGIFSFSDLGNVTWEAVPGTTKIVK